MQDLFSLVQCLTTAEWQGFQNYLTCFSTHEKEGIKYLQLAKLLREVEECPNDKRCCVKLYGVSEDISFDVLKTRLKDKVLDFLLTDISADKRNELDSLDYAYITIKKKSAQYQQLFYSKPRTAVAIRLLDEVIVLAKEYEYYFSLVEHLKTKRGLIGWKASEKEFERLSIEIDESITKSKLLLSAEHRYHTLITLYDFKGKPNKIKITEFLRKTLVELSEGYSLTKSPIINYYLKMFEMDFFQLKENFLKARSVCLELLDVVRNNKSVYRRQRIGVVYDHLSRCEYYLGHYKQATEWAREAQKHFNAGSENFCIALEQEFYALFAQEKYQEAEAIANKMLSSATRKELGEFRHAKYNVLLANALFKLRRFNEALHLLSQEMEISKDKAGWETGARTLKIMTLIEMLKLDEASLAVLSLKQFFKRADKKTPISLRDKKILNLLLVAERAGFMFSTLNGNTDKYFDALTSSEETLRWEPFTHELIRFDEWFADKMPARHGAKKKLEKVPAKTAARKVLASK